ncbi:MULTISPECIES: hypothetical protein [Methylobacterium]|jgi:hypothetical protein|uniref:hypothetical protein n=1 Tax=Methylobacterium TaxID=407 RepID=UPI00111388A4|nr:MULTISPECIES: hypothetical protein [Methylobacterium]MBK3399367.1 hypothetical protein [Methylobacterium ajmalii]MBK3409922.1 hypothetical protein [Methylobacterium ajmalii]MBK3423663.1 hypothetical protein [Methylobacterium ajmalii]MBZ6415965.1 hypothetical protein [Methylobacterium sp.]
MSVSLLLSAAQNNPKSRLAQVSSGLHFDLDVAGELATRPIPVPCPTDPDFGEPVNKLLRSLGVDPEEPANFSVYYLRKYPAVTVQLGGYFGLSLTPTGPNSFVLK